MWRVRYAAGVVALVGVVSMTGCGGGGSDNGSSTTAAANPSPGGDLFTQNSHTGSLKPIAGQNDVFTLTLDRPSPDVTVFTDRPVRSASTEGLPGFVQNWDERGFNQDPPNAALVLDQEPDNADTAIFELTHPVLDNSSGAVSYTAKHVNGGTSSLPSDEHIDPPPSFGDAHLFIDPSGGGDQHVVAIDVNGAGQGVKTAIAFDSPWTISLGPGEEQSCVVGPNVGGCTFLPSSATLTSAGGLQISVAGGAGPITGTATIPRGATVGAQVDDNPEQPIKNGKFSLSP
jgi:hypothetical protein